MQAFYFTSQEVWESRAGPGGIARLHVVQDILESIPTDDVLKLFRKTPSGQEAKKNDVSVFLSPVAINAWLKARLNAKGWYAQTSGHDQVDFTSGNVLMEAQFGKYPFIFYDILVKMPSFAPQFDVGIELVLDQHGSSFPLRRCVNTGIGCFRVAKRKLHENPLMNTPDEQFPLVPVVVLGWKFKCIRAIREKSRLVLTSAADRLLADVDEPGRSTTRKVAARFLHGTRFYSDRFFDVAFIFTSVRRGARPKTRSSRKRRPGEWTRTGITH